jgi:hypothetical protein
MEEENVSNISMSDLSELSHHSVEHFEEAKMF